MIAPRRVGCRGHGWRQTGGRQRARLPVPSLRMGAGRRRGRCLAPCRGGGAGQPPSGSWIPGARTVARKLRSSSLFPVAGGLGGTARTGFRRSHSPGGCNRTSRGRGWRWSLSRRRPGAFFGWCGRRPNLGRASGVPSPPATVPGWSVTATPNRGPGATGEGLEEGVVHGDVIGGGSHRGRFSATPATPSPFLGNQWLSGALSHAGNHRARPDISTHGPPLVGPESPPRRRVLI